MYEKTARYLACENIILEMTDNVSSVILNLTQSHAHTVV